MTTRRPPRDGRLPGAAVDPAASTPSRAMPLGFDHQSDAGNHARSPTPTAPPLGISDRLALDLQCERDTIPFESRKQAAYPEKDAAYPEKDAAYPEKDAAYPEKDAGRQKKTNSSNGGNKFEAPGVR